MIDYGIVQSTRKPEEITIDDYSVWKATNITETTKQNDDGNETTVYEYNLTQYTKDEYILTIEELNKSIQALSTTFNSLAYSLYVNTETAQIDESAETETTDVDETETSQNKEELSTDNQIETLSAQIAELTSKLSELKSKA